MDAILEHEERVALLMQKMADLDLPLEERFEAFYEKTRLTKSDKDHEK